MAEISVIVPVYKVEPYLDRCVRSILEQSYEDIELILVDDGSPDRCGAMCEDYADQDCRVHVIHRENGGLSAARNSGIDWVMAHSDSHWLTFVDSDDWLDLSFLKKLYDAVTETGCRLAACEYYTTQGEERKWDTMQPVRILSADDYYCSDDFTASPVACAKLYSKELFYQVRYPVGKLHEDEFVTYRIVYNAQCIAYLPEALYAYYQNPNGIILSQWNPRRMHILEATQEQIAFARQTGNNRFLCKAAEQYIMSCCDQLMRAGPEYHKQLRAQLRSGLKLGRECGVFPASFDHLWAYEAAYPIKPFWWVFFKGHALVTRLLGKEKTNE